MPDLSHIFFEHFGAFYRWVTANPLWRESLREMARHLPPSAAELTLLDVGCGPGNSALEFSQLRPDLRIIGLDISSNMLRIAGRTSAAKKIPLEWAQADITKLPLPDSRVDAITGHSVSYLLRERPAFLREAMRVLRPGGRLILLDPVVRPYPFEMIPRLVRKPRTSLSVLGWHAMSRMHRRYTLEQLSADLSSAGFARVLSERAAEGYGILSRGEKPFAEGTATIERIAQVAGTVDSAVGISSAVLPSSIRGKFVFLLVEQTPNKPAWALKPGEAIRWEAAQIADKTNGGKTYLLAFTSLPKAVRFMQPAVMSGLLIGINKVAKFDKNKAPGWNADILLNPDFEGLRTGDNDFGAWRLAIDPSSAVTGDE